MSSVLLLNLVVFGVAAACLVLADLARERAWHVRPKPESSHRCRAMPLFSQLGRSSFQLDAVVASSDDPTVTPGTPFSLQLTRPNRRSDFLFAKVRASVERGHALFVEVEDYLSARKARLCANGWTVVLKVDHASGWPVCNVGCCAA